METEVSCLRRRLAEEDRGKGEKNVSAVCVCVLSDPSRLRGGGRSSVEVGSLPAITSRNVSNDRSGSKGVTIFGPVFLCPQISVKHTNNLILTHLTSD